MIYNRAAYRYAKATLQSCLENKKDLDLVFEDMKSVSKAFEESKELKLFVDSKVVKDSDKINTLKSVFKNSSKSCLLYTSPSPRDGLLSRMPSSA